MATRYSAVIATTHAKLRQYGRPVVVRHFLVDEDAADGPEDTPTEQDTQVAPDIPALVSPPSTMTEQAYADQFRSGEMVRSRTRNVLMAARDIPFRPQEGDELDFDGHTWTMVGVAALEPDGTPIFYRTTVKR